MSKRKNKVLVGSFILVGVVCAGIIMSNTNNKTLYKNSIKSGNNVNYDNYDYSEFETSYVNGSYTIDYNDYNEVAVDSDYIFIGTVDEYLGSSFNPEFDAIVKSSYKVTVDENLKGKLMKNIIVKKSGGYDFNDKMLVLYAEEDFKDFLPEVGRQYIFVGYAQQNGDILLMPLKGNLEYEKSTGTKYIQAIQKNTNIKNVQDIQSAQAEYKQKPRERYVSKYEQ